MFPILLVCISLYGLTLSEVEVRRNIFLESDKMTHEARLESASSYRIRVSSLRRNGRRLMGLSRACSTPHFKGLEQALSEAEFLYVALDNAIDDGASSYFYVEFMVRVWAGYQEFEHIFDCQAEDGDMMKYSEYSL